MVVDDTPANLSMMEKILTTEGYEVAALPSGVLALRTLESAAPELILLDIMMPDMNGFDVCRKIKADPRWADIPVLFISALDDTANKLSAFMEGGVDYVTKPFQPEEVLARIRAHICLRQQQQQIAEQNRKLEDSMAALKELEKQRDQMVHMMVHDLRSPLTALLLHAEYLEMSLASDTELGDSVETIVSAGRRLRDMITLLLDISRMEANQMPVEAKLCDLRDLIDAATKALSGSLKRVTLDYQPPPTPCDIHCDPDLTQRVIENLLGNAIKFSPDTAPVRIEIVPESESTRVLIIDKGPGIAPEYHQMIFEKFAQTKTRSKQNTPSSGLGLAFCKLAVQAQSGTIGVESEEGKGSTFWFSLPHAG